MRIQRTRPSQELAEIQEDLRTRTDPTTCKGILQFGQWYKAMAPGTEARTTCLSQLHNETNKCEHDYTFHIITTGTFETTRSTIEKVFNQKTSTLYNHKTPAHD